MATTSSLSCERSRLTVRALSIHHTLYAIVWGELDCDNAHHLGEAIRRARSGEERVLVVDVAGLTFLDARGARALDDAAQEVTGGVGRLKLRGATGAVALVLRICPPSPARTAPAPRPVPPRRQPRARRRPLVARAQVWW